jgi:type VI secretion system protein ImpE
MDIKTYFQEGKLKQAILMLTAEVKKLPEDINKRYLLAEFLCIRGELVQADKQLDIIIEQEPAASLHAALFRQLIRAEQARRQCFTEGALPSFFNNEIMLAQQAVLKALVAMRENNLVTAYCELQKTNANLINLPGSYNDKSFVSMRDCDDFTASFLEILTSNGKYYWLPFTSISSIEFRPPIQARDLLWRRAHLHIYEGPEAEIFIPAIYIHTHKQDEMAQLGYETHWQYGDNQPTYGSGQRLFLIDDNAVPIMEIENLQFTRS